MIQILVHRLAKTETGLVMLTDFLMMKAAESALWVWSDVPIRSLSAGIALDLVFSPFECPGMQSEIRGRQIETEMLQRHLKHASGRDLR